MACIEAIRTLSPVMCSVASRRTCALERPRLRQRDTSTAICFIGKPSARARWMKRSVQPWIASAMSLALLSFVLKDRDFRSDPERLLAAVAIGLTIVGGWYVTGHVGFIAEDPDTLQEAYLGTRTARPESFTFIGPAANALELLQFWTDKAARLRNLLDSSNLQRSRFGTG